MKLKRNGILVCVFVLAVGCLALVGNRKSASEESIPAETIAESTEISTEATEVEVPTETSTEEVTTEAVTEETEQISEDTEATSEESSEETSEESDKLYISVVQGAGYTCEYK